MHMHMNHVHINATYFHSLLQFARIFEYVTERPVPVSHNRWARSQVSLLLLVCSTSGSAQFTFFDA